MSSSKPELKRLEILDSWQSVGAIKDLVHQAPIKIIDTLETKYSLERNSKNHARKPPLKNTRVERIYTPDFAYKIPSLKLLVFEEFKSDYTRVKLREAYSLRRQLLEQKIKAFNEDSELMNFIKESFSVLHSTCKYTNLNEIESILLRSAREQSKKDFKDFLSNEEIRQGYKIVFFENEFIYYKYAELVDELKRKLRLREYEASLFDTCE